MDNSWWAGFSFILSFFFLLPIPPSKAQLVPAETRILLQLQQYLENPPPLQQWNQWTNFCLLPPSPSLTITCSNNHITQLTIVGNKTSPSQSHTPSTFTPSPPTTLSSTFSIDSFFTDLTKLTNLQNLSLLNLGLWGPLPPKINRLKSLQILNISSNFIYGQIPSSISTLPSLKSLILTNNLLNGTIPDLSPLPLLQELDLTNNHLGPQFPSLGPTLLSISIRNNSLRSQIPQFLNRLTALQLLDVSSNRLLGPIPQFLLPLPSLRSLSLAGNQFSGEIPANSTCGKNLGFVDISNNLLIGRLPGCLSGNKRVVSAFNCLSEKGLRNQRPYSFCQKDAIAVRPPEKGGKRGDGKGETTTLKLGVVLGIIGGIVGILGVLGCLVLVVFRKVQKRRNRGSEYKCESFVIEKGSTRGGSPIGRHVPQPMRMTSLGLPPYHVFTLEDMEDATNNFEASNLVGEGSQGQLYKGWLRDGTVVLVKCLKLKQKHSPQALQQHMEVISKLRHRHLVSVLGHCIVTYQDHPNTASTVFIVLENIANGSLKDHMTDWRKREVLKWPQRMAITMGIARGIQYLHTAGVHGNDLKIDTILLDDSLTAKISSYNINLPSKVGAESPFHGQETSRENPEKEDIYKLGVILIEVITGRPVNSPSDMDDLKFQFERSLAESPSKLRDMIDPSMRGTFAYESLKTVVQITINCLCNDPNGRPTVEDVLWHMQYSVQVQEGWTSSGNLSGSLSGNLGTKLY